MDQHQLAFDVAEVCKIARVSRSSFYEAINEGQLRAVKRGRRTLILRADLEAWLASFPAIKPSKQPAA